MDYKLIKGSHNEGKQIFKEGSIIKSDAPLNKMFPDKFEALETIQPVPPRVVAQPEPKLVINPVKPKDSDDDDDEDTEEVLPKATGRRAASTRPVRR